MKKLKKENGAITIITLVSILFMISFLISSYMRISNKVKSQKEILNETKEIYESKVSMEEIYNSYFNNSNIIPIYTVEQLFMMGKEHNNVNINGKYYNFNNNENTIYVLMNDLKIKASDYLEELENGYWVPVGEKILAYEQVKNENVDTTGYFMSKFQGNNNNIEVIYTDTEDEEYSVIYSQSSNYCEPEYEVNVKPILEDGNVAINAKILKDNEDTGLMGETKVKIKRLEDTKISAYIDDSYIKPEIEINISNPNKISDITLEIKPIDLTLETSES